jgi:diacylglycerol kinase family enzyme
MVDDAYFAVCCNTNPYTYLGTRPLDIAPEATLDRGLVLVSVRSLGLASILGLAGRALAGGGRIRHSHAVDYRVDLTEAVIEGYGPFPFQVDGDYLGEVERLTLRHEPAVLDLLVP